MGILRATTEVELSDFGLTAGLSEQFQLQIDHLEDWLIRIAIVPAQGLDVDRSWMIAPDGDVPWEGRDRLSADGFSCPPSASSGNGFEGSKLAVRVEEDPLRISVEQRGENGWGPLLDDRANGAWQWFERGQQLRHFQRLNDGDVHYGLGDKTGPMDRTGRRLRCLQSDALGYNAETSDPLYKHAPFVIVDGPNGACGLLYDTMAETTFDLGAEHSNYFERFRHVEMQERGAVVYVIAGPRVRDVVPRLHALTGRVAFPPRWSMGFAFTSMHHTDAPNAPDVITGFVRDARRRDIPISALHLGSGYAKADDGLRYVFQWNCEKFPDREGFFKQLKAMGLRTVANIKPVLLTGHGEYKTAEAGGWFVRRADGVATVERFWDGFGSSLDFTNRKTIEWWQQGVTTEILGAGFDAAWNDNNECELWDETAALDGFGKSLPAMQSRPVHALLMTRASFEATKKAKPNERPFTISRAGPIGIARYGETWSGDNKTSWHTLKWNLRQGLSMSLSGMPLVGHDIGGFDGPPPEPELLVRWFQMMVLHPRCVMNSWKPDEDVKANLPWMHEEVVDEIRAALELRYGFLPFLYNCVHQAHKCGHPVIAPPFYHFADPICREDANTFMLGTDVLVAPVVEQGAESVRLYLPRGATDETLWLDFETGAVFEGGQWVELEAPLGRLPILVKNGSLLPLAQSWPSNSPHDAEAISLTAFCALGEGRRITEFYWDDGSTVSEGQQIALSLNWRDGTARVKADNIPTVWPEILLDGRGAGAQRIDWSD